MGWRVANRPGIDFLDGRIHPARIEEIVGKTIKNIEEEIIETGEKTVIDLGIHGLHPELIKMVDDLNIGIEKVFIEELKHLNIRYTPYLKHRNAI